MRIKSIRLLVLIFIAVSLSVSGCGKKAGQPRPVPEGEAFSVKLLNARFSQREGRWLALETRAGNPKPRLIELNKPTVSLDRSNVSETDRMNGVSERYAFSIFCEQYRYWDGTWSEWKKGTGGDGTVVLVHAMTGGLLGYQHFEIEKKNGGWNVKSTKPPALSEDRSMREQVIVTAFSLSNP